MKKAALAILAATILLVGGALFVSEKFGAIKVPRPASDISVDSVASELILPKGFGEISVYADGIADARAMIFAPGGALLVSQPSEGKISAIADKDGDGEVEISTVVSGLDAPHGMEFRCTDPENPRVCDFYVAETSALSVFSYDPETMSATDRRKLLDLPRGGAGTHFTRSLSFLPYPHDSRLLVSIGSSCNVCHEEDDRRAKILAYNVETGTTSEYARGLRNAVFMEIHPVTGDVWATEMGRDGLGDDLPPDEINIIEEGSNYGWPICYGKNVHDSDFDKNTYVRNPCMEPFEKPSHIDIQAHSAPLGLAFVPEEGWPDEYWFNALVAYHGSWNRSVPTGYKVVRMKFDARGEYLGTEDFITGWLKPDGTKLGRPVDVMALPGGVIFISDDEAGRIYKVTRG